MDGCTWIDTEKERETEREIVTKRIKKYEERIRVRINNGLSVQI